MSMNEAARTLALVTGHSANDAFAEANVVAGLCHELAVKGGWWAGRDMMDKELAAVKLALVHSEISEALEGVRKGKMDDHLPHRKAEEVELADAMIRILDLAGARQLDVFGAMMEKMAYNITRADHTAEGRAAEGGKSF